MNEVILDTCVIIDIFEKTRSRHEIAKSLGDFLIEKNVKVVIPIFSLFEIHSAVGEIRNEHGSLLFQNSITKKRCLPLNVVSMDDGFFQKYYNPALPYTKAGDLILLSMAEKDKLLLITEDVGLLKKAKQVGVSAYTIKEFMQN
jgi:rRNA-processing protein FCF1